jgi:hypothetical protein
MEKCAKSFNDSRDSSWFENWKLTTFKHGFGIGMFVALVLQLGIIEITRYAENHRVCVPSCWHSYFH